jgi:lon-related putative ATP-dependent protease
MTSDRTQATTLPAPLQPDALRWTCPLDMVPAETTEGVEPIEGIIGQERALKALKLGVELYSPGYNIFVCGLSGTGKATTIKTILETLKPATALPQDLCYVFNFRDEDRPMLLRFPRGQGSAFRADVAEALDLVQQRIPRVYEDAEFTRARQALMDEYTEKNRALFESFEETIAPDGFVVGNVQEGQAVHPEILAKVGEKVVMISDLDNAINAGMLTEEQAGAIREKYKEHRNTMQELYRVGLGLSRDFQRLMAEHERNAVAMVVTAVYAELLEKYTEPRVHDYLDDTIDSILSSLERFKEKGPDQPADEFVEYTVNLLLDNQNTTCCPVIIETAPTFTNLFGTVERQQDAQGFWYTDFTRIKSGSVLRANGGFLVLNAADTLSESGVWRFLQRVLLYRKLEIQAPEAALQQVGSAMKPEAIDLNLKVILIGNNELYWMLDEYERDFKKIFKVKADFDHEMPLTEKAVRQYAALIRKLVSDEDLTHFDAGAIAAVVEYGARLAESRKKLTTQFSEIADIVREANYWCGQNNHRYVTGEHVARAIREARDRHALSEVKLQELIDDGVIMIDCTGERVGQINGLAVYGGDRYSYGKPARITAAVGAGEAGIINIERESRMSGSTHDKGVLILTGYLRELFAQRHPLTLTASLSFEQSYSGIDGDSASSTEVYALLSALSGVPLRQTLAVTGSVNQKGDIQPIGGVNEKIEGFFDVCAHKGLTGAQGVIIPEQNVSDLMLRDDVVQAVREGRFRITAVSTIAQGIELLTGFAAGERDASGGFPPESVFGRAAARSTPSTASRGGGGRLHRLQRTPLHRRRTRTSRTTRARTASRATTPTPQQHRAFA